MPLVALVLLDTALFVENAPKLELAALVAVLSVSAIFAYLLRDSHTDAAPTVLVLGAGLTVLAAAYLLPRESGGYWFSIVVLVAGMLLGPFAAGAAALASSAAILALPSVVVASSSWAEAACFVWATMLISWVAARPMMASLAWAWHSYDDAQEQREELQRQRGDLNRALKSLNEAYGRLEAVSRELTRAREAAEEARRIKAEFAATISHELRTPLNLIIGFSEMMVMAPHTYGDPLPPGYRSDAAAIYRNARHLSSLVDDVLDLSRVDAARLGMAKERVSINEIVEEAGAAVSALFEAKGLWLRTNLSAALPTLYVDRARIRQVVINLLNNAARFTEKGGVTISTEIGEGEVVVTVADTGVGVADEDLPKLFEEFRQLDQSARRRFGGTGLGLAISKRFVDLHGGRVWAESEVGRGTTFHFALPCSDNVTSVPIRREWETWARLPETGSSRSAEVVIATDDPDAGRILQRYLDGYNVLGVQSVEEVRRTIGRPRPDAIVVVSRPNSDGTTELRRLRGVPHQTPIVVCTLPGHQDRADLLGVSDYLVKPLSRGELLAALDRAVGEGDTVLVADDDPEMVALLGRMIKSSSRGYRVLSAGSGSEAVTAIAEGRPDCVVLDLIMPGVDGYGVIDWIRASPEVKDTPVIVVTAHGHEEEAVTAGSIRVTREGGLALGEVARAVRASLDALLESHGTARRLPGEPAG